MSNDFDELIKQIEYLNEIIAEPGTSEPLKHLLDSIQNHITSFTLNKKQLALVATKLREIEQILLNKQANLNSERANLINKQSIIKSYINAKHINRKT